MDIMNDFLADFYDEVDTPLDAYEAFLLTTDYLYTRPNWDRLVMNVSGRYAKYRVEFQWLPDDERMVATCLSEIMLDPDYETLVAPLFLKINRSLPFGHFDINVAGNPVFKHSYSTKHLNTQVTMEELDDFRVAAVKFFDRHYAALSVMNNHMRRLADAGFVLEMDDFLPAVPAVNDNPDDITIHNNQQQDFALALMDVQGEG